jgi:hypothetical protein
LTAHGHLAACISQHSNRSRGCCCELAGPYRVSHSPMPPVKSSAAWSADKAPDPRRVRSAMTLTPSPRDTEQFNGMALGSASARHLQSPRQGTAGDSDRRCDRCRTASRTARCGPWTRWPVAVKATAIHAGHALLRSPSRAVTVQPTRHPKLAASPRRRKPARCWTGWPRRRRVDSRVDSRDSLRCNTLATGCRTSFGAITMESPTCFSY